MKDKHWIRVWHKGTCATRKPRGFCDCGLVDALNDGEFAQFSGDDRDYPDVREAP